jgi:hypothetical protein
MESLFICASELSTFIKLHPEYNHFEKVYDIYGELAGYNVSIIPETK